MPRRIPLTRDLASRAAWDEGDRSMRAAGRTTWNEDDANAAWAAFRLLWPPCPHKIDPENWCSYCGIVAATGPLAARASAHPPQVQ